MSGVEQKAKAMENLILEAMAENKEQVNETDRQSELRELADTISVGIKLTTEFQELITENFDDLEPDERHFRKIYFDTQTMGYVLLDRLYKLNDKAQKLIDMLYNK